jgi:hypothetical protein
MLLVEETRNANHSCALVEDLKGRVHAVFHSAQIRKSSSVILTKNVKVTFVVEICMDLLMVFV